MEPWITTFTGKHINPLRMKHEDMCIEDIAHQLACQTRWVGATKAPVFTAQHCVFVANYVQDESPEVQMQGLLHEIPEAYLGDMSKWVKESPLMSGYRAAERHIWIVACQVFTLWPELHEKVLEADRVMAGIEAHYAMHLDCETCKFPGYEPTPERLWKANLVHPWKPWDWRKSESLFMLKYLDLKRKIDAARTARLQ